MNPNPFAAKNLATYEIIQFYPTKWSKEFESMVFVQGQEDDPNKIPEELKSKELIFYHSIEFGKTKHNIENPICDEFWEVSASVNV